MLALNSLVAPSRLVRVRRGMNAEEIKEIYDLVAGFVSRTNLGKYCVSGPSDVNRQRIKLRETLNNPESYKFYRIFIRYETDKANNILQQ